MKKLIAVMLTLGLAITGCTSAKTAAPDQSNDVRELQIRAGDTVLIVTTRRQRFLLEVLQVEANGLRGETKPTKYTNVPVGHARFVAYEELALVTVVHSSPAKTAGLVAMVTAIGAVVIAIATSDPTLVIKAQ